MLICTSTRSIKTYVFVLYSVNINRSNQRELSERECSMHGCEIGKGCWNENAKELKFDVKTEL